MEARGCCVRCIDVRHIACVDVERRSFNCSACFLFPALQAPLAFLSTLLGALAHLSTALLTVLTMLLAPFFTLAAVGLAIGIASLWVAWFQRQAQRALSAT